MKTLQVFLVMVMLLHLAPLTVVVAQEKPQVFALPDASAGHPYRAELEKVLREKYRLRLESGAQNGIIQWTQAGGELPPGLSIRPDGTIVGTSTDSSEREYDLRLKAIDVSAHSEELVLEFTLKVKPATLRLVRISGPGLVPIDETAPRTEATAPNRESNSASASGPANSDTKTPAPSTTTPLAATPSPQAAPTNQAPLSSKYMRALIGIEQAGVSSGTSAQNPFLDFFFNAGLTKTRLAAWGDVRLTSTPQQVTAFVSSASNTAAAATGTKVNDLATSFAFKFGPEYLLNRDPNARIRTSIIAGFGAASTLTAPSQSGQIFKLPSASSSQFASFISQYPEAKTPGVAYIAFVPLERDRFFRQYFMGFRIRSYQDDDFPAMLDITFGQNSAVTGGQLRHFVLGVDGSYRLSLMGNAFYIFGSANLKVGGPKYAGTPFILDPADNTVKLTDANVVITSRQLNRDFYRIGFGVDLIKLFNPKSGDGKK